MPFETDYGKTILPLDAFRRWMGIDPYHFWQMEHVAHPMEGYSHYYPHERWQYTAAVPDVMPQRTAKRGPGRLDFIKAIADAEDKIAQYPPLNTWPGPKYSANEEVRLKKPRQAVLYTLTPFGLLTRWWHVQTVGVQTWDPLGAAVALVYDATDDVMCSAAVTSDVAASEVVVCYAGTTIPIRPIEVTISGVTATITLKKWMCGDPNDWETADPIDANDTDNLIQTVDVYRVWIDTTQQIILGWEPDLLYCDCTASDCVICSIVGRTACAVRKDYRIGYVGWQVAEYDGGWEALTVPWPHARFPDLAYISYVHGFTADGDRYMSTKWQRVVSQLAAADLPSYVVDTTSQPDILYDWRIDLAKQEEGSRWSIGTSDLDNPFGTKRGHIAAWKAVKEAAGS